MTDSCVAVAASADVAEGHSISVQTSLGEVLLARSNGQVFAVENRCTHQHAPLVGGRIRRGMIACPLHSVMFDLATGTPRGSLTKKPLRTFGVSELDGVISLTVPM